MAGHDFVDTFAQELLPALWAVRLPYGLPREAGERRAGLERLPGHSVDPGGTPDHVPAEYVRSPPLALSS